MRRALRIILMTAAASAVILALVWAFLPAPVDVAVGRAVRGDLIVTVDHEGQTRVKERYVVSSPLAGRLLRVEWKPGDPVVARQTLLAVIEPADPELLDARARQQANARVDGANAARKEAGTALERARILHAQEKSEVERLHQLRMRQTVTEREYEMALFREQAAATDVRAAEFAVRIAEFELKQAESALIHTEPRSLGESVPFRFEIPSPITGAVLRVLQESSTVVSPGTPLLEVGDPKDLECVVDVLSTDAVKVEPGQRVILEYWGGEHPLEGRVRVREPAAFTKISALGVEEQRVNIIIDLMSPPEERPTLGDAYRVEARIVVWEGQNVLQIPAGALFRHEGGWAAFLVRDDRAILQPVKIGRSNGLETEILSGLEENDRVVLHPSDRVEDGVAVAPL